jgi:hypothetical protein
MVCIFAQLGFSFDPHRYLAYGDASQHMFQIAADDLQQATTGARFSIKEKLH